MANQLDGAWAWAVRAVACLALLIAWAGMATAGQVAPELSAEQRQRWGLYAELAGRDFELQNGDARVGVSFRWDIVGQQMTERWFAPRSPNATAWAYRHELDPSSGELVFRQAGTNQNFRSRAQQDGSIVPVGRWAPSLSRNGMTYVRIVPALFGNSTHIFRTLGEATETVRQAVVQRAASGRFPAALQDSEPRPIVVAQVQAPTGPPAPAYVQSEPPLVAASAPNSAIALGPRIALVIGIGSYGTLGDLPNPVRDASALAQSLRGHGFSVELVLNPDQRSLRQALSRLGERMAAAGSGATGLFFFAGHGIQSRGQNYLIPAGAQIAREADLSIEAVTADAVLVQMQEANASTSIIILDACRNMPLARSFRSGGRGLAQMDAPNGTFISYSTAPGSVAADGDGVNSPYATALLQELNGRGQPIEALFRNVRRNVLRATNGQQTPWDASSLIEPFYFSQ